MTLVSWNKKQKIKIIINKIKNIISKVQKKV